MSNKVTFKGKIRWANVPPHAAKKPFEIDVNEPDNTSFSIEVECSQAQFDDLMKRGIPRLTALRKDEEGTTFIRLKATKTKGSYTFPDPKVVDVNGDDLGKKIANGSEGLVTAELSPIKGRKGVALRLRTVMITKLIEFGGDDDVAELVKQVSGGKKEEVKEVKEDVNNDDW